jgi:hypothetical protein
MYKNFARLWVLFGLLLFSGSLFSQSPGGISRTSLWLKGNFFEDTTLARNLNFNPATLLDEVSPGIKFPGTIDDLRRSTIFTVFQQPDISQDKMVWELSDGHVDVKLSSRQLASMSQKTHLAFADSLPDLFTSGSQSIISTYIRRERAQDDANAGSQDAVLEFGRLNKSKQPDQAQALPEQGLIAEFIVYRTILKDKDIARIETYLGLKYGITLQRNYISSDGETIWNRKEAKTYSNNIAGIGRDDQSGLYQKQSTSSSGTDQMIIGVNKIVKLNSLNTGLINDNDYLIWGDNGSPFKLEQNKNNKPRDVIILLSEKKWLMKSAGISANRLTTQLKINIKTLLSPGVSNHDVHLIIDRSGTGNFNIKDCSYFLPDNISDEGIASFSGINWDTDRSGKDVFTFGVTHRKHENIVESGKILSFQVYPNPVTNGNYQVAITLDKPAEVTMQIYDNQLRLVESRTVNGQSSYHLSGHVNGAKGAYIVKLLTPGNIYSKILIVQ